MVSDKLGLAAMAHARVHGNVEGGSSEPGRPNSQGRAKLPGLADTRGTERFESFQCSMIVL